MKKFVLLTRGRTGSTAVIDELHQTKGLRAAQELFLTWNFDTHIPEYDRTYNFVPPLDVWKQQKAWWKWLPRSLRTEDRIAGRYLGEAEALAQQRGALAFGFKVLSNNLVERPYLEQLLQQRGYCAIYLTRNLARQVISGMVASQSGIFNSTDATLRLQSYCIDLDKFQALAEWERREFQKDLEQLTARKTPFTVVTYEDFCGNRGVFYGRIFEFLGLPLEMPARTDYTVLIKDLSQTIENYQAVAERAAAMGLAIE